MNRTPALLMGILLCFVSLARTSTSTTPATYTPGQPSPPPVEETLAAHASPARERESARCGRCLRYRLYADPLRRRVDLLPAATIAVSSLCHLSLESKP